ncbi:MAG: hypothetical protein H0W01_07775, partial [Pseudonocardiales bacterium]|nr:hypothetical protein [Pseudonocardiales bacterium]
QAHLQAGATSLFVYVVNLALTSEVDALSLGGQPLLEVAVLTAVAAIAGIARFALLRQWVFRPARRQPHQQRTAAILRRWWPPKIG